ncbi:MAG: hypothetical protein LIO60_03150, partial [Oscillospiraceae bacterium]|nr:hypothetical protein [Oscillospiraceae bacterium]
PQMCPRPNALKDSCKKFSPSYRDFPDSRAILASHSGKPEKYQKGRTDMKQFLIGKRIGAGMTRAQIAAILMRYCNMAER